MRTLLVLAFCLLLISGCQSSLANRFEEEPTISLYIAETGEVRNLRLEEYIKGVVAAEMEPTWAEEALGAQAILARTFLIERMIRGKTQQGTDASTDTTEFQAYDRDRINLAVARAVEETKGIVAVQNDRPIRAYFHSCSGGITASADEGLAVDDAPNYLQGGIEDPPCEREEIQQWQVTFTTAEINAALGQLGIDPATIDSVEVGKTGDSGRAEVLVFGQRRVSAPEFRIAIGPDDMKSTLLTSIDLDNGSVVMKGRGWGHGVGMSQWGAYARAEDGATAEQIINAYYHGIDLIELYD